METVTSKLALAAGKVRLRPDEHPTETYSGLVIPETAFQHDSNVATVLDGNSSLTKAGARVVYYGWAPAVHLEDKSFLLKDIYLVADVSELATAGTLEAIRPLNGYEAVLLEDAPEKIGSFYIPDNVPRQRTGTVLTGEYKGWKTAFMGPVGIAFDGDMEGVRIEGTLLFVKKAHITLLWRYE